VITDRGKTQVDGIPRVYGFGPIYFHNVLVMDRFGPSLESIFAERERRFTVKTVVMLAKRMVCIYANPEILSV
jgi:casein kinase 1